MKYIINEPAKREKSAAKKGSGKSGENSSLEDAMFEAKVNWLGMRSKLVNCSMTYFAPFSQTESVVYKVIFYIFR